LAAKRGGIGNHGQSIVKRTGGGSHNTVHGTMHKVSGDSKKQKSSTQRAQLTNIGRDNFLTIRQVGLRLDRQRTKNKNLVQGKNYKDLNHLSKIEKGKGRQLGKVYVTQ